MAACRRGCQTNLVALALYCSECQFRTVSGSGGPVNSGALEASPNQPRSESAN
jgi:hypothetical protein